MIRLARKWERKSWVYNLRQREKHEFEKCYRFGVRVWRGKGKCSYISILHFQFFTFHHKFALSRNQTSPFFFASVSLDISEPNHFRFFFLPSSILFPYLWLLLSVHFSFFHLFTSSQTKQTRVSLQDFFFPLKIRKYSLSFVSFNLPCLCVLCSWPSWFKVKASACCLSLNVQQRRLALSFLQDLVYQTTKQRKSCDCLFT